MGAPALLCSPQRAARLLWIILTAEGTQGTLAEEISFHLG